MLQDLYPPSKSLSYTPRPLPTINLINISVKILQSAHNIIMGGVRDNTCVVGCIVALAARTRHLTALTLTLAAFPQKIATPLSQDTQQPCGRQREDTGFGPPQASLLTGKHTTGLMRPYVLGRLTLVTRCAIWGRHRHLPCSRNATCLHALALTLMHLRSHTCPP